MEPLTRDEALALLARAGFGRIVFSHHALPAIRPVNHILDGGSIVVRTHEGAALNALVRGAGDQGVVVAYEADEIDPGTRTGWSVIATGYATAVTDPAELDRYRVLLRPVGRRPPRPRHPVAPGRSHRLPARRPARRRSGDKTRGLTPHSIPRFPSPAAGPKDPGPCRRHAPSWSPEAAHSPSPAPACPPGRGRGGKR
ncbi:pyridoxamine 5'-phosphate oxidase family protein [Yinghuangia aomiensis]